MDNMPIMRDGVLISAHLGLIVETVFLTSAETLMGHILSANLASVLHFTHQYEVME